MTIEEAFSDFIVTKTEFLADWKYLEDIYTNTKAICAILPTSSYRFTFGIWLSGSGLKGLYQNHTHWDTPRSRDWAPKWEEEISQLLIHPPQFFNNVPTVLEDLEALPEGNPFPSDICAQCMSGRRYVF